VQALPFHFYIKAPQAAMRDRKHIGYKPDSLGTMLSGRDVHFARDLFTRFSTFADYGDHV
jgi:hypothetical protein